MFYNTVVLGRRPLHIFAGYEIEADVGKGTHVLCIFGPDIDLAVVESRLSDCGMPPDRRFKSDGKPEPSTERLPEILDIVQKKRVNRGIVVCPHAVSEKGILDDGSMKDWLQKEEFTNPDLLCVEVPKPVEQMSDGWQKLLRSAPGCDADWRRRRSVACISSSDCYRIYPDDQEASNTIDYRYTWIKMSEPSVEALRQAFLDHESRVRVCPESPETGYEYPQVRRVEVDGATFYQAEALTFSPNLNCIIGSRGAGKSTLLDYIRLAFDRLQPDDLPVKLRNEIRGRIKDTLKLGSRIVVDVCKSGVMFRIDCLSTGDGSVARTITDLDTQEQNPEWSVRELFPLRVLSQREIDQSVDLADRTALSRLLDDFVAPELRALGQTENDAQAAIASLEAGIQTKQKGQSLRGQYLTQKVDIEGRLKRLDAVQEPLQRWTRISSENAYLGELSRTAEEVSAQVSDLVSQLREPPVYEISDAPHEDLLANALHNANEAQSRLAKAICEALDVYRRETIAAGGSLTSLIAEQWKPIYEAEERVYQELRKQLEEKGDKPQDYLTLVGELTGVTLSGHRGVSLAAHVVFRDSPKLLQSFTWLKPNGLAGLECHLRTGTRISADACLARAHIEDAKAAQLNAPTAAQGSLHTLEDSFNCRLRLRLGDPGSIDDFVDDIGFDQGFLVVRPANGPWLSPAVNF